jgi:hypothetical protein
MTGGLGPSRRRLRASRKRIKSRMWFRPYLVRRLLRQP